MTHKNGLESIKSMDWQFRLFGKPEIWHHQAQLDGFNTQKTQALMYYLVAEGSKQNRNDLARFFWDDFNLISSQNNLRTALYHLKQDFESCLEIDRQAVCFQLPPSAYLDLELVDAVSPEADQETLEAAVDAYRGEFLEGFTTNIPQFEAWKESKQAHYRQTIIKYLLHLAESYEKERQHQDALETVQRIIAIDPTNESAVLLQMRLAASLGQQEQAIQAYHNYQERLQEFPEATPSALITEFYNNLKVHIPNQVLTSLPSSQTRFFGREAETRQLTLWLKDAELRWINLVGHKGIGKTRLAIHTAEAIASAFKDGIHYFDLHGTDAGQDDVSIENVSKLILYSLRAKLSLDKTYVSQLHDALTNREMVLILDNLDTREWQLSFTTDLLLSTSNIKLLVISRQPIDIPDPMLLELKGLAFPTREGSPSVYNPDFVAHYTSLQMFEDRAQRVQPGFRINQTNFQQVTHICRVVQGMPLGIENIAYQLGNISLTEIMGTILGDTSKDPATPTAAALSREMLPVFDYIWSNLPPKSQEIALASALFKGSFTKDTFSGITQEHTDWLIPLVESSLLHMKFSPHYLAQDFLNQQQEYLPERYATQYYAFYLNKLIELDQEMAFARYPINLIKSDQANMIHAWELAHRGGDFPLLTHACMPLARMFAQLGLAAEGCTLLEKTAASLEELPRRSDQETLALGSIALAYAHLAEKCANRETAHGMSEKAHNIAQELGHTDLLAGALQSKASLSLQTGDTLAAVRCAYDGLTEAVKSRDKGLVAAGIIALASAYCNDHQYQKAMTAYKTALDEKLVSEDSRHMQALLIGLSACLSNQGHFNRSLATNQKAQHLNEKFTDPVDAGQLTFGQGVIDKFQGQLAPAVLAFSEALPVFSSYKRPFQQALALSNLGILRYWKGEYEGALQHLYAAEDIARDHNLHILPEVLALKARVLQAVGQQESARACLQEASRQSSGVRDEQDLPPTISAACIHLALSEGSFDTAHNLALTLLPSLKDLSFDSLDDPFSVYLSVYNALKNRARPAAREVLAYAQQMFSRLTENATPEATQETFLTIPHRRELSQIIQNQTRL